MVSFIENMSDKNTDFFEDLIHEVLVPIIWF
jgi:hypothetical protein